MQRMTNWDALGRQAAIAADPEHTTAREAAWRQFRQGFLFARNALDMQAVAVTGSKPRDLLHPDSHGHAMESVRAQEAFAIAWDRHLRDRIESAPIEVTP